MAASWDRLYGTPQPPTLVMNLLTASEIHPLVEAGATLVHVLPEEHFDGERLPGAVNACVYEMAFVAKVREVVPDRQSPVIVYGAGGGSLDSEAAAAKLVQDGYTNVHDFRGGLAEWKAEGRPVEGTGIDKSPPDLHGTFAVDTGTSLVRWTGRNLFNFHHGTLRLAGGRLDLNHGALVSAQFVLDMNSIACDDLTDSTYNALLIRHLRDNDFFAVDRFPTAECVLSAADPLPESSPGTPNHRLRGTLTVRGVTQPLEIAAVVAAADDQHLTGQAQFEFDRTVFGSHYGSGRLFAFLGKHVVNDHVHVHVALHATRE